MPVVKNFVFCLNTDITDGKTNILGALAAMTPEYIPGLFSFSVYFTILDLKAGDHQLTLQFKDSNNSVAASVDNAAIRYDKDETSNLPDEYAGVSVAVNLQNVNITHSGLYQMEIILDGQHQGAFDIYVKGKNESKS